MKNLVIVESPSKSKTIEKYLGKDYKVVSSKGHIRDLATKGKYGLGVDLENNFAPTYEIIKGKKKMVSDLKKEVKAADKIYLATDPDREGEAISWHLKDELNIKDKDYMKNRIVDIFGEDSNRVNGYIYEMYCKKEDDLYTYVFPMPFADFSIMDWINYMVDSSIHGDIKCKVVCNEICIEEVRNFLKDKVEVICLIEQ